MEASLEVNPSKSRGDTLPVERVSWEDCQRFCKQSGLSLPTEAQWEYACRAGTSGPFAGTGKLDDMGWVRENSAGTTHPIGKKQPNDFGLHDMHGNVWEWCEDWYQADIYNESAGAYNPKFGDSGFEYLVIRGGSWVNSAWLCPSAFRNKTIPSYRGHDLGFRPIWSSRE